jgi:hypothetical protein
MRLKEHRAAIRAAGRSLAVLCALLCVCGAAQAVVYKWLDAQGNIHYSDRPPEGDVKILSIENVYERPRGASSGPASPGPSSPGGTRPVSSSAAPAPAPASQGDANDAPKPNADGCRQAKERLDSVTRNRRVFKEGANGERIYLSDQELQATRLDAQKDVDDNCVQGQ